MNAGGKGRGKGKGGNGRRRGNRLQAAEALEKAVASKDIDALKDAIKEAEKAKVAAAEVDAAKKVLAQEEAKKKAREAAGKAADEEDIEALREAIKEAEKHKVAQAEIDRLKAHLAELVAKEEAEKELKKAMEANDVQALKDAIKQAEEAKVPEDDIDAAKEVLAVLEAKAKAGPVGEAADMTEPMFASRPPGGEGCANYEDVLPGKPLGGESHTVVMAVRYDGDEDPDKAWLLNIGQDGAGGEQFALDGKKKEFVIEGAKVKAGRAITIAAVYDGATKTDKVYLDGILKSSTKVARVEANANTKSSEMFVGRPTENEEGATFKGCVLGVDVHRSALTGKALQAAQDKMRNLVRCSKVPNQNAASGLAGEGDHSEWPTTSSAVECSHRCRLKSDCAVWSWFGASDKTNWKNKCVTWSGPEAERNERHRPVYWSAQEGAESGLCEYVVEMKVETLGAGCIKGAQKEHVLFNGWLGDYDACKDRCLSVSNCRYFQTGWHGGTSTWCTLIRDDFTASAANLDSSDKGCGSSGSDGVHVYRPVSAAEAPRVDGSALEELVV